MGLEFLRCRREELKPWKAQDEWDSRGMGLEFRRLSDYFIHPPSFQSRSILDRKRRDMERKSSQEERLSAREREMASFQQLVDQYQKTALQRANETKESQALERSMVRFSSNGVLRDADVSTICGPQFPYGARWQPSWIRDGGHF